MLMNVFDNYLRTCAMKEDLERQYYRIEKKKNKSKGDLKTMNYLASRIRKLALKGDEYQEYFFGNIYD